MQVLSISIIIFDNSCELLKLKMETNKNTINASKSNDNIMAFKLACRQDNMVKIMEFYNDKIPANEIIDAFNGALMNNSLEAIKFLFKIKCVEDYVQNNRAIMTEHISASNDLEIIKFFNNEGFKYTNIGDVSPSVSNEILEWFQEYFDTNDMIH